MSGALTLRDEIAQCLSKGMTTPVILERLDGRSTRGSIKTTLVHMRKMLCLEAERGVGQPRKNFAYVRLSEDADTFLRAEANQRGITTSELAMRILDKVAADALVEAVLDDGGGA